ncbi:MAG: carbohydrate binding domain-containing protein [Lentisphaeria bacterium]|nr:carbohydrate binding domain-containing protein [Lentisphaeria bacterium]
MKQKFIILLLFSSLLCCFAEPAVLRRKLCLNGEWECHFSKSGKLTAKSTFEKCRVPSSWGKGGHRTYEWSSARTNAEKAFFKTAIQIPQEWKSSRVKLFFEMLEEENAVFINGQEVHRAPHMIACHEIDITDHIIFGKNNTLIVESGAGQWAGILRDVYLLTVPETRVQHALVMPSFRKKELSVRLFIDSTKKRTLTAKLSVIDGKNTVLEFAPGSFTVDKNADITLTCGWKNPVLWGYGKYGTNKLYRLKTVLEEQGKVIDTKYETFGFREFYTQGSKFMLNGKEIFLKGDLYHKTLDHTENPLAAASFLKRMRDCNINFLRHHSGRDLDSSVWFEIGDETGFIMEPEMKRTISVNGKAVPADHPRNVEFLTNYVKYNFNHPSIISWSIDNETFSVGLTTPGNLRKINQEKLRAFNNLHTIMRKLDPTRPVEMNHNYSVYPFIRMRKFDKENFMIFNIHPYGNLKQVIENEQKAVGFNGSVPVLVGEIFAHGRRVDFIRDFIGTYIEQKRIASSYATQIAGAASAKNVSGVVLCAQTGDGFCGFVDSKTILFGPWDDFARIKKDGKFAALRSFIVRPHHPSLSGRGAKTHIQHGWKFSGGWFGLNFNYFDKNAPEYRKNLIDNAITESFRKIDGQTEPRLPEFRNPEVVVTHQEKGCQLWCQSEITPEELYGVVTDSSGTGYFRLNAKENYRFSDGKNSRNFKVDTPARRYGKPGYDHIFVCEMGGKKEQELRKIWNSEPEKITTGIAVPNQYVENNSFEFNDHNNIPFEWKCVKTSIKTDAADGKYSLAVSSNGMADQRFRIKFMQPGKSYRISGNVKKVRGGSSGEVMIMRSGKNKFIIEAGKTPGKWEHFSQIYRADGTEYSLRCVNLDKSKNSLFLYDNIKIEKVNNSPDEKLHKGPFAPGKNGEICNFLILGPFPNPGTADTGWYAASKDLLAAYGGENNVIPQFGKKYLMKIEENSNYLPGEYQIRWKQLHSATGKADINNLQLEEAGITGTPPSHVAAIAGCEIISEREQQITLSVGSDDGYIIYLNGREIGRSLTARALSPDQEQYQVTLKKGTNILLIKTLQESGFWQFMVKLIGADNKPAKGVKIFLAEEKNLLENGDFSRLDAKGKISGWNTNGKLNKKEFPAHKKSSLQLDGHLAQAARRFKVKPGEKYRIEGWIKSSDNKKKGNIGIRLLNYKWVLSLQNRTGEWEHVSGEFTVPENTRTVYVYCKNHYAGKEAKIHYADLKIVKEN